MFWVVPLQLKAMAAHCLGDGDGDLVRDALPDEDKGVFIGSYRVHSQRTAGVCEKHRPDARNYHYRLRVREWDIFEPVKPVSHNVYPQRRIHRSDR